MNALDTHGGAFRAGHGQAWHTNPSIALRGKGFGPAVAEELEHMAREAMALALNELATEVYEISQKEVPKSGTAAETNRFGQTLAESGKYPGNDPEAVATPQKLEASVTYDQAYARAQHEGKMTYESRGGKPVAWEVHSYTTAGTKSHYLSDPFKACWPKLEALAAEKLAMLMAERFPPTL